MNLKTIEKSEVYHATTYQYKIKFNDGTIMEFRVAEDSNGTEFYVLAKSVWIAIEDGNKYHNAFCEALLEGSLD